MFAELFTAELVICRVVHHLDHKIKPTRKRTVFFDNMTSSLLIQLWLNKYQKMSLLAYSSTTELFQKSINSNFTQYFSYAAQQSYRSVFVLNVVVFARWSDGPLYKFLSLIGRPPTVIFFFSSMMRYLNEHMTPSFPTWSPHIFRTKWNHMIIEFFVPCTSNRVDWYAP